MPSLKQKLQQDRADKLAAAKALLNAAEAAGALTPETQAKHTALLGEIDNLGAQIATYERQEDAERTAAATPLTPERPSASQVHDLAAEKPWGNLGAYRSIDDIPASFRAQELDRAFGEFAQAALRGTRNPSAADSRLVYQAAPTGLGETIDADGGYLVPKQMATELLRRAYQMGAILSRVRRLPITVGNGIKINAVNETSRATGSRWGGIRAYWKEEAGAATASAPKFRVMDLGLNKLIGLCYATDELLADAQALGSVLQEGFAEEFTFQTEDAIINGNGAGMPDGILVGAGTVSVAKETGQALTTLVAKNVMNMRSRLWAKSRPNSVWLINQDVEPQLHQMTLAVGTGGVPVYLPASGLSEDGFDRLYGRPVIPVEYCATLGTKGDVILVDLSQYLLIDKGGVETAQSLHVRFLNDEITYRWIYRVDGQPIWNAALTPFKGTANTVSPYVVLADRL